MRANGHCLFLYRFLTHILIPNLFLFFLFTMFLEILWHFNFLVELDEWIYILSFFPPINSIKWKSLSRVRLFVTPWYSLWNSPGQNTGVGSLSLLQGIFPTQELNPVNSINVSMKKLRPTKTKTGAATTPQGVGRGDVTRWEEPGFTNERKLNNKPEVGKDEKRCT